MGSELARRVAVAAVGIPVAVAMVYAGGVVLAVLLAFVAALGFLEFHRLAEQKGVRTLRGAGVAAAVAAVLATAWVGSLLALGYWIVLALIAVFASVIWLRGVEGGPLGAASLTLAGAAYTGGTLSLGYLLRHLPAEGGAIAGTILVFFPVVLTWVNDSAAYFGGRAFGSRKLIPSVSPAKTVEGALIGLLATAGAAVLYLPLLEQFTAWRVGIPVAVGFGIVIGVAAQVGDLFESAIKRDAGVKDSGTLLPGHGGILDRFDSLYFVLPIAYLILFTLGVS